MNKYSHLVTFRITSKGYTQIVFFTKNKIPTGLEWNNFTDKQDILKGGDWIVFNLLTLKN